MSPHDEKPPSLAWAMWKRFLVAGLLIVVLTATATATAGLMEFDRLQGEFERGSEVVDIPEITRPEAGEPQTILVLGSDRRYIDIKQKNPVRSDTLLLVRLDPDKDSNALLSIPRDLKVDIPHRGRVVTDKINAAYALGGARLTVRTVKRLLNIDVHHVVNVNFGGFKRAVNRIGCVYVDVDRRYYNDNTGPEPDYATIDVKPGYQKLCGQDALDYVRYRHEDTDLVRAARQQDFLRQAQSQVGIRGLLRDRTELIRIFSRYTQTDRALRDRDQLIQLLKLAIFSADNPIREVHFRGRVGETYVTASANQISKTRREFLEGRSSSGPRGRLKPNEEQLRAARKGRKRSRNRTRADVPGLVNAAQAAQNVTVPLAVKARFPVYYPRLATRAAIYAQDIARTYAIRAPNGRLHRAYRIVVKKGIVGEYYGVQGTTWRRPPILEGPSETRTVDGRKLQIHYDGRRVRLVAWRTPRAVYWVSNTLLQTISERQMVAIARSLRRIG